MVQPEISCQLERLSLGRLGLIGELYDARTESLSSTSLFKSSTDEPAVQVTDISQMELEYKLSDSSSDRFEMFKVQGELQVAVLMGLVKVNGSAKYLTEESESNNVITCSLLANFQTVSEKLMVHHAEILPFVDLDALNDPRFTHVIVEVSWGANCVLSLEATCNSEASRNQLEGLLEGELKKLKAVLSVKGEGMLEETEKDSENSSCIRIRVSADVLPADEWPSSVEGFQRFVQKLPELLKAVNNGKGKPLKYFMIPLSELRKLAKLQNAVETEVKRIDESFITSVVCFFEEVAQVKRKFHDLLDLMKKNSEYIPWETIQEAGRKAEEISGRESELKSFFCDDWVLVRSGEKALKDLVREFERFKSHRLNLYSYEEFLESCSAISKKLSRVQTFRSQGADYLGRGSSLEDLQTAHPDKEFVVMVTSTEMEKANPELHVNNSCFLISLAKEPPSNTICVVLDLDYNPDAPMGKKAGRVTCVHLKGTKVLSFDLLAKHLEEQESNFARLTSPLSKELCRHKPGNRVVLEMTCPGFLSGKCPSTLMQWKCNGCNAFLEYGFDDNYYCSCGKASFDSFQYRCKNESHTEFISAPLEFLKPALSALRPLKELNVLVIGQSGVGKSTWINSIVNYLTFDSLEAAREAGAIVVVPGTFTLYDPETKDQREIKVGTRSGDEGEVREVGSSCTQFSRTYSFLWEDRCVRIIDTPGLGDVRGIDQDKENLSNLINHISYLEELHAVCILMRANENRMTALFTYCVKELFVHLHRNVIKNILFCFTTARNSFYSPGSASVLLRKLIDDLRVERNFVLGQHNMFSLDNEAFLFLCAIENGMRFNKTLEVSFKQSWELSLEETRRLFETIKDFTPHKLKETMSLVTARMRVLSLTKPLAEISKTIQLNINACLRKKEELSNKELTVADLSKKLTLTEVHLQGEPLKKPRTVCTTPDCVTYLSYESSDVKEIEYVTHCHVACYLRDVTPKTVNNPALKNCKAMKSDGFCSNCGCSWQNHMHLTYSQKRVEVKVTDKGVESRIKRETSQIAQLEAFKEELEKKINKYKSEEETIIQTTAKLGMFLKENAITVYNDSLEDYLLYLIKQEEDKPYKSEFEEQFLQKMKENLEHYRAEVRFLTDVTKREGKTCEKLTPEDVCKLEDELYKLELTGNMIKDFVTLSRSSGRKAMAYVEEPVHVSRPPRSSSGHPNTFNKFWSTQKNKISKIFT